MAVVKMGQIKSTPAKALAYIARPDATSDGLWVSTNAAVIDPGDFKAVAQQFAATAARVGVSAPREGSVLAHHVIQSFDPKEGMTAELAHRIGVQLAEQITGGSHEYMIATHLDKGHVHNHIIFNAVNLESGKKFRVQKSTIGGIRDASDALCVEAGLSVLPKPERATGRSMRDTYRVLKGESAKEFLRTEIDKAAARARSWVEFEAILARAGIETSVRGGRAATVSFREISMGRPVRDYRLGASYTEESIMARMSKSVVNMIGVDASMIVRESRDTITVAVPGTKRELHLTVAKTQMVRRQRSLRLYVPASHTHVLSDKKGGLGRTVSTAGLYQFFSEPNLAEATRYAKEKLVEPGTVSRWSASLNELRALTQQVNAKARWMQPGADAEQAVQRASAHLADQHLAYQTTLVAATELMADPTGDTEELRALMAELRILERDLVSVKTDIRALSRLTADEVKMSVADRINAQVMQARSDGARRVDAVGTRLNADDQAGDRATPAQRGQDQDARSAHDSAVRDHAEDRDVDVRPLSLQERLAAAEEKAKADRERTRHGGNRKGRR